VSCDVSRAADDAFRKYSSKKGVGTPLLWTASFLEATLRGTRRDLLFSYFGLSEEADARVRASRITRNIELKKRLRRDLRADPKTVDWDKMRNGEPYRQFEHKEVIVHNVDDDTYPDMETREIGISGWFKLELWHFYHNGLEFILRLREAICDASGRWALI